MLSRIIVGGFFMLGWMLILYHIEGLWGREAKQVAAWGTVAVVALVVLMSMGG